MNESRKMIAALSEALSALTRADAQPEPVDMAAYRTLIESAVADAIDDYEAWRHAEKGMEGVVLAARWRMEGLCLALRLLGGYGDTVFDVQWAACIDKPRADWKAAEAMSYVVRPDV